MSILKYKIIRSAKQHDQYCKKIDQLISGSHDLLEEIALLSLLIEKYKGHDVFTGMDPVEVLSLLMQQQELKQADLVRSLKISPGVISDILNYRKRFSKNLIRQLSSLFNISQEAFNRSYKLKSRSEKKIKSKKKVLSFECSKISKAV